MINFENIHKIYFVGIGGIGMSAAANIARSQGFEVLGSDGSGVYPPSKDVLDEYNIPYFLGYEARHIVEAQAGIYIVSAGEGPENPEVQYILDHQLPRMSFAELLYNLYKDKLRIVIAGTNGKSTTTGLVGHLLKNLDDSSFMAGAVLQNHNSNFYVGQGHYAVFEGDEYKSEFDDPTPKFHFYKPDILVLTNLEFDHPDVFENFAAMEQEFRLLIAEMPEDGLIVYNADDTALTKLVHESNVSSASFGIENEADFKIEQVQYGPEFTTFEIQNKFSKQISSKLLGQTEQYKIQLPGKINVYNALAAAAVLRSLGFSQEQIALDLLSYRGVKRRFEVIGRKNGITLVDDYAHHPTAIQETLAAARLKYFIDPELKTKDQPSRRLWAIFEPHTFSRTQATLPELATAFNAADEVLISSIYPAREKIQNATITSEEVVEAVKKGYRVKGEGYSNQDNNYSSHIRLVHNKQEALDIIKSEAKEGDVVIVMAVGSFNKLAYELKEIL